MKVANQINTIIDKGADVGETMLLNLITEKMIVALALTPSGLPAAILVRLLSYAVKKFVFPVLASFKRNEIQYQVDVIAGKLYLKKLEKIDENTSLDDVLNTSNGY